MTGTPTARMSAASRALIALQRTLESGQVFHWNAQHSGWTGLVDKTPLHVEERGGRLYCPQDSGRLARHYFALDHDLEAIVASFPDDPALRKASAFCRHVRILRQPPWECIATFLTSTQKQVAHIRQISTAMRIRHGTPVPSPWGTLHAYPDPERVATLDIRDLQACAMGYRAHYVLKSARMIADGRVDLDAIAEKDDEEAETLLRRLPGVGPKVARCILLFAYGRLRAFPVDVWIDRVFREVYFKRRKMTPKRAKEFAARHFGPYGGYAQQYLFHYARSQPKTRRPAASP